MSILMVQLVKVHYQENTYCVDSESSMSDRITDDEFSDYSEYSDSDSI